MVLILSVMILCERCYTNIEMKFPAEGGARHEPRREKRRKGIQNSEDVLCRTKRHRRAQCGREAGSWERLPRRAQVSDDKTQSWRGGLSTGNERSVYSTREFKPDSNTLENKWKIWSRGMTWADSHFPIIFLRKKVRENVKDGIQMRFSIRVLSLSRNNYLSELITLPFSFIDI